MKRCWAAAVSLCLLAFGCGGEAPSTPDASTLDWWDDAFQKRRKLRFAIPQAEDLIDFPVLVRLDANRIDYGAAQESGNDLRFVDEDDTVLAYEIEAWNPAGESQVWVRVPKIDKGSTVDSIWMYYGNESANSLEGGDVWTAGYQAVWHLGDNPSGTTYDSTANANHGTAGGGIGASSQVPGQIGGAVSFNGVDEWIEVPNSESLDITGDQLTLSAWVYLTGPQLRDTGIIVKAEPEAVEPRIYNYQIGLQSEHVTSFRVHTTDGVNTSEAYLNGKRRLIEGEWYFVSGVYDGLSTRVSIDVQLDRSLEAQEPILSTIEPLMIGRRSRNDERYFVGYIDEARVSTVARSDAWLNAQYQSMTDELVVFEAEQNR